MEIEDSGLRMEKERDCIIKYTDSAFNNSSHETVPDHNNVLEHSENINGDSESQSPKKSTELSDCEVKECTSVNTIQKSGYAESAQEEQKNIASKFEHVDPEKKTFESKKETIKSKQRLKRALKHSAGQPRTKCTIPQPFSMATYKRVSSGVRPTGAEPNDGPGGQKVPVANNTYYLKSTRRNQQSSPSFPRKPRQPDIKKHPDDDDSYSIASCTAITRQTNKSKTLVAFAPVLRCTERAEKRKEFCSKLEEKHQALVAEKSKAEERTKEEVEAAIKQLRKRLVFKANPMPSFYHEGPSPKIVLKKQPSTRAKSPNLGRRKSCSDAGNLLKSEKEKEAPSRSGRHSHSSYREFIATVGSVKDTGNARTRNGTGPCKLQVGPKKVKEIIKPVLKYSNEKTGQDIAVH